MIATRNEPAERGPGGFVFNPVADTRLGEGDELIVLGTVEQIDELRALAGA